MARNRYAIVEQRDPEPAEVNRYRIIEFYFTIDGMRTRLTNHTDKNIEVLRAKIKEWETS